MECFKMANEKRLIDANALVCKRFWVETTRGERGYVVDFDDISDAPTVDAKKVVHGHWTPLVKNGFAFGVTCSKCNTTWDDKSNYCPNCGAKMDGGNEDGQRKA